MTRLIWDAVGERLHEIGVDRGVLYVDDVGYPWNGLVSVEEAPTGAEPRPFYLDGEKYLNLTTREEFAATLNALYSPVEFDQCEGIGSPIPGMRAAQQRRKTFALSYRSMIGNDLEGTDHGYKIHIIYNALVQPTTRTYASMNADVDIPVLSWPITTKPIPIPGLMRSAHITIDTTTASKAGVTAIEELLYGSESVDAVLPSPQDIIDILVASDDFEVTDLGDGLFRISGSDTDVLLIEPGKFRITHDTVVPIDGDTVEISST